MFLKIWRWFWSPSAKYGWGGFTIIGAVVALLLWGGFSAFVAQTSTLEFCISCHEMEQLVFQEYKKSIHYKNSSGVRVICADCHVPKAWVPKMRRKIQALGELYHAAVGTIDTPEKFEAKRLELAERVWATMKANDSLECRNCHSYDAMDFHKQRRRSSEKMQEAMKKGETCIECHKGIAHKLPNSGDDEEVDD